MNIRMISQYATLVLSFATLLMALVGMYLRPDRFWLLAVAWVYAAVDVVFYVLVLVFGLRGFGNDFSPHRTVIQASIITALLYSYMRGDFKGWIRKWT